jgi:transcriptional regulator with XRE-family HTH domain
MPPPQRRPGVDRAFKRQAREAKRALGRDLSRVRLDAGASHGTVAALAGIDRSYYSRIEAGTGNPTMETLAAISVALGADVSIRIFPGTGPRLTDRHQARMVERLLRSLDPGWKAHVEVTVSRPVRGVIDVVLERRVEDLLVATEAYSELRRLEQQIRWSADKAAALGSSHLAGPRPLPTVSRLLVLEATLRAAYPARTADVIDALLLGSPWPGAGLVWVRIDGDRVELLDGPPRGVTLGR